jgi:hypothetical protein
MTEKERLQKHLPLVQRLVDRANEEGIVGSNTKDELEIHAEPYKGFFIGIARVVVDGCAYFKGWATGEVLNATTGQMVTQHFESDLLQSKHEVGKQLYKYVDKFRSIRPIVHIKPESEYV